MNQIDIPHLDSAGRRVYWVFVAPFDKRNALNGPAYIAPEKMVNEMTPEEYRSSVGKWVLLKPYCKLEGCFMHLDDKYHDWLVDNGYSYVFDHRWTLDRFGWYVGLHDKKAAAHFKLVFGQ